MIDFCRCSISNIIWDTSRKWKFAGTWIQSASNFFEIHLLKINVIDAKFNSNWMVIEGHSIFNYSQSSDSFGLDIIIIIFFSDPVSRVTLEIKRDPVAKINRWFPSLRFQIVRSRPGSYSKCNLLLVNEASPMPLPSALIKSILELAYSILI